MPSDVQAAEAAALGTDPSDHAAYGAAWQTYFHVRAHAGAHFGTSYTFGAQLVEEMTRAGMVYPAPGPELPRRPFGWRRDVSEHHPLYQAWLAEIERLVSLLGPDPSRGIPAYKFSTSDGWLIHPEELDAALDRLPLDHEPTCVTVEERSHWVGFLQQSLEHGGIRVR
jgi:hypothetical protein